MFYSQHDRKHASIKLRYSGGRPGSSCTQRAPVSSWHPEADVVGRFCTGWVHPRRKKTVLHYLMQRKWYDRNQRQCIRSFNVSDIFCSFVPSNHELISEHLALHHNWKVYVKTDILLFLIISNKYWFYNVRIMGIKKPPFVAYKACFLHSLPLGRFSPEI